MFKNTASRNVFFVLFAITIFVLKRHYSGPLSETVHAYLGNISVSFAVYFVVGAAARKWQVSNLLAAGGALLVVELFEATNGFGVMSNVFDKVDFIANAVGVGLALALDTIIDRMGARSNLRQVHGAPDLQSFTR